MQEPCRLDDELASLSPQCHVTVENKAMALMNDGPADPPARSGPYYCGEAQKACFMLLGTCMEAVQSVATTDYPQLFNSRSISGVHTNLRSIC